MEKNILNDLINETLANNELKKIADKVFAGKRISDSDGVVLFI